MEKVTICLAFMLVLVYADVQNYDRKPYGRIMCDQLCQEINGCTTYMFSKWDLSCGVTNISSETVAEDKWRILYNVHVSQKNGNRPKGRPCSINSKIFTTRTWGLRCDEGYKKGSLKEMLEGKRFLLVTSVIYYKMFKVDLKTKSKEKYPYITGNNKKGLLLVPSMSQIWVVATNALMSYPLNNDTPTVILKQKLAFTMTLDEQEMLVFFTLLLSPKYLCSIGTNGENLTKITLLRSSLVGISIISNLKLIILGFVKKLMAVEYDGRNMKEVFTPKRLLTSFTVDPVRKMIYFPQAAKIYRVLLGEKISHLVASFPVSELKRLVYNRNILFVVEEHTRKKYVVVPLRGPKFDQRDELITSTSQVIYCII